MTHTHLSTHFRKRQAISLRGNQGGMTLVIGLILLVMLMVVSVVGFRNTTLSERMTGNAFDRNVSFQSAESAGKEALEVINTAGGFVPVTATISMTTVGQFNPPITAGGAAAYWTQGAGATLATPATDCLTATSFNWTSCSATVATKYANNANKAQYVIEFISSSASCVTNVNTTTTTYRVTSRSTGGSGDAEVVLQTIYSQKVAAVGVCP